MTDRDYIRKSNGDQAMSNDERLLGTQHRDYAWQGISPWDIAELRKTNEELRAVLDELIACNDLRQQAREAFVIHGVEIGWKLTDEHDRRAPLAWAEARRLRGKT